MIRSFFLTALRSIGRNRVYFLVSVASLAFGIAAMLIISVSVRQELSFDSFHTNRDRIVRINSHFVENDISRTSSRTPFPLKAILLQDFPEVEAVARYAVVGQSRALLNFNGTVNYEDISIGDPEFIRVFDFEFIRGDRLHALDNPNSVVISEKIARRYFGDLDALGKTIRYMNRSDLTVTGVVKNLPVNSHIQFDILIPTEHQRIEWRVSQNNFYDFEEDWLWNGAWTYVLLREGADKEDFAHKIAGLPARLYPEENRQKYTYQVHPLSELHFSTGITGTPTTSGNKTQMAAIVVVGVLILMIAAINFVNLTSAQAPARMKEVGLRKTLGAHRGQVMAQILSEILIVVLVATLAGIFLAEIAMPVFSLVSGKNLTLSFDFRIVLGILIGLVILTLGAGIYPALLLSRPKPGPALRGGKGSERHSVYSMRSGLVIIQLSVSIILIGGIITIQQQVDYIRNMDLGFDRSQIVTISNGNSFRDYETFKQILLTESGIEDVYRGYFPGSLGWNVTWTVEGKPDVLTMPVQMVEKNFVRMFGLSIIAGRDFLQGRDADSASALINNKMAKEMGWTAQDAVGRNLSYIGGNDNKTIVQLKVVGVIRDANFESLYKPIQPMIFQPTPFGDMAVKIAGKPQEQLQKIEKLYKSMAPGWPFEFSFLDADIDSNYQKEQKLSQTLQLFAVLAICISCSGLLALCSFVTRKRMKELAIRKVHGASVLAIVLLLGRYFLALGAVSLLISIPATIFLSREWLSTFAYAIKPGMILYFQTAGAMILLVLAGISYHIMRASVENPARILKSE